MTRQIWCAAGVLLVSTLMACGPRGAPATPAAGDPKRLEITMTRNDGIQGIDAVCVGTVAPPVLKVKRGHKVEWYIRNSAYNACPDLKPEQVNVMFDIATLADDMNTASAAHKDAKWTGTRLERRVHKNPTHAPDMTKRKYYVYYLTKKASPDPELDIDGDCGSQCGPP